MKPSAPAVLLLLGACYAPTGPAGAPCDPAAPACPAGQACAPAAGGGFACSREPGSDGGEPDGELGHVLVNPGWSARVFHDFSASFTYVPSDFVDGDETYSNQPDSMFVLRSPFNEALAVVAGRVIFELTANRLTKHDFGGHAPNTAGKPDHLRAGTFVPDLDGTGYAVLLTSSSDMGGDGTFRLTKDWSVSSDRTTNNTRAILWDETGQFDAVAKPEGYLGTMGGVVQRSTGSAGTAIIGGDTKTMHLWGSNLLLTRQVLPDAVELIEVASGVMTHEEKVIVRFNSIELGEGPAPASYAAWVIVNRSQLALLREDGSLVTIAESRDGNFDWQAAAAPPPPPHALAGATSTVYVLESNRALGIDRVLAIEARPL